MQSGGYAEREDEAGSLFAGPSNWQSRATPNPARPTSAINEEGGTEGASGPLRSRRPGCAGPRASTTYRSTFASNALAAGISVFELGRIIGTSVAIIERHYGTLIEGAGADIARRLDAFEADQDLVVDDRYGDV
jgi:hypothetical protein